MGNTTVLVVEPHPDDGLYSAAGTMLELKKQSFDIISLCLFSYGQQALIRQKEHETIYRQIFHTDCIFAPFEDHLYRTEENINNMRLFVDVRKYILSIFNNKKPIIVLGPIGIGSHPDHIIAHTVLMSIKTISCETTYFFYEDFPYCVEDENNYKKTIRQMRQTSDLKPVYNDISEWLDQKVHLYEAYLSQRRYPEKQLRTLFQKQHNQLIEDGMQDDPIFNSKSFCERLWVAKHSYKK